MKKLITEKDAYQLIKSGTKEIYIEKDAIVTPAAQDVFTKNKISILRQGDSQISKSEFFLPVAVKSIAIGSDHTGYRTKSELISYLRAKGLEVHDMGTNSEEAADYPDFAYAVANSVSTKKVDRGICIDATGIPSAIVANKVKGVRAAVGYNEYVIKSSRAHNDSNVLSLGARVFNAEILKSFIDLWLRVEFEGGRHQKRLDKITEIENKK